MNNDQTMASTNVRCKLSDGVYLVDRIDGQDGDHERTVEVSGAYVLSNGARFPQDFFFSENKVLRKVA